MEKLNVKKKKKKGLGFGGDRSLLTQPRGTLVTWPDKVHPCGPTKHGQWNVNFIYHVYGQLVAWLINAGSRDVGRDVAVLLFQFIANLEWNVWSEMKLAQLLTDMLSPKDLALG